MDSRRRRELAQLISRLDKLGPGEPLPLPDGCHEPGRGFRIGITGPVGAGKSTLISQLTLNYRGRGLSVGIIAVDPTSPFSGGALLGDRVRMADLVLDEGVFVRSLATRGASGGLAMTAVDAVDLLDAFGFERLILETVGVGQSEVDVAGACDVTCVILEPGAGDSLQAMKAGLMEIADLFVVNKKDMRGADRFILDLASVLELKPDESRPDILAAAAGRGEGVPELCDWLENYRRRAGSDGTLAKRRAAQRVDRIKRLADAAAVRKFWERLSDERLLDVIHSDIPVREAAHRLVEAAFGDGG